MSPGYPGVKSESGNWHGIPNLKINIGNADPSTVRPVIFTMLNLETVARYSLRKVLQEIAL